MKLATLFLLLAGLSADAAYVLTNVFTGSANNDGTGDSLRLSFSKINSNFWAQTNSIAIVSNSVVTASNTFYTANLAASNNLQSQITAESTSLATNTASFGITNNFITLGARWTNYAQRAELELEMSLTDAVGGVPKFSVTIEQGTITTNNWQLSPVGAGLGGVLTSPITNRWNFMLNPSAVAVITDTSSGGASAVISRSALFR